MNAELGAIASAIAELADVLSDAGLAEYAVKADNYAERLRGWARMGVPRHIEPTDSTGVVTLLGDDTPPAPRKVD